MILISTVVAEVRPGNERGGGVIVRVIVVRVGYRAVLPGELVWRGGERGTVVLEKQLAGGRYRAEGVVVRREGVKVEAGLCSADAIRLCRWAKVVDIVFGGRVECELECMGVDLCLGSSDHGSACSDNGIGRPAPPLGQ